MLKYVAILAVSKLFKIKSTISRPGATAEDDGVLVSALIRGEPKSARSTALLVLDARDLRELARAEFVCEGPVPKPLHGYFTGNNRFGK